MPDFTITIPGIPPRPGRAHHMAVYKAKRQWANSIYLLARHHGIPTASERRSVAIAFRRPGRLSDPDNAHAMCKVPLDALVRAGLLVDDSPDWVALSVTTISGSPSETVIAISW